MRIIDIIDKSCIDLNFKSTSKEDSIEKLTNLMVKTGCIKDKDGYKKLIIEREELSSTGIGHGIAIPHGKGKSVYKPSVIVAVSKEGIDFDSIDGEKVHLIFMIAVPDNSDNMHLEILSRLSTILMNEEFRERLISCNDIDTFLMMIDSMERIKFSDTKRNDLNNVEKFKILAVTACPNGIAHTYMAAEALENAGKKKGISIKVETNGSSGVKNMITDKEIIDSECIIIAADKSVDIDRFDGKRMIRSSVSDGIYNADKLIDDAINGGGEIYHCIPNHEKGTGRIKKSDSLYEHLMNGISSIIPFMILWGVLISIERILNDFNVFNISVFLEMFSSGIHLIIYPILAGFIAMSIGDKPAFLVGAVGGYASEIGISFIRCNYDISADFIGAIIAGFIGGYIIKFLKSLFSKLDKDSEGIKPMFIYPVLGSILIIVLVDLINPILISITYFISNNINNLNIIVKIIIGLLVGCLMSIDMGGRINKMTYLFGILCLTIENYNVMAAVMAGGMVPPLIISFCTLFFKDKFTDEERKLGYSNFKKGLFFITEGVIPFVKSDKRNVIISCTIGAAISGGLSMAFDCMITSPHGGIFIIPIMINPFKYIISILIGSIIGAFILGKLRK